MIFKQFWLNLLHQFHMIIVQLCFSSFEVTIIWQLSKIQILSGKTFTIDDSLIEVLYLIDLLNLLSEFSDSLLHFILLLDQLRQCFLNHFMFLKTFCNFGYINNFRFAAFIFKTSLFCLVYKNFYYFFSLCCLKTLYFDMIII